MTTTDAKRPHDRLLKRAGRRLRRMLERHRGRARGGHDAGFTLVETLAAFTVLTLVLIVLLGDLSGVVGRGGEAEARREALRLAQSKLDGLGVTEPISPGEHTGRFDNGFEWLLRIGDLRGAATADLAGAWVEITVAARPGGTRSSPAVSLVTFKLVRLPPR